MSNAASAQSGGAPTPDLKTELRQADGGRAHAMAAKLQLAAKDIEALAKQINDTVDAANKETDERGSAGVIEGLKVLFGTSSKQRDHLSLVWKEQKSASLNDSSVREAFQQVTRANRALNLAEDKAKRYAQAHHAAEVDVKTLNNDGVDHDVLFLEDQLKMKGTDDTKAPSVKDSTTKLQNEALDESVEGLIHGAQALKLAMHEANPAEAMQLVLPGLLSSLRLLDASLLATKPSIGARKRAIDAVDQIESAWNSAGQQLQQDSNLIRAHQNAKHVVDKFVAGKK